MTTFPGSARVEMVMGIPVSVDIRTALPRRELAPVLDDAFAWVQEVLSDPARSEALGKESRALAEREFALEDCASRFEDILRTAKRRAAR